MTNIEEFTLYRIVSAIILSGDHILLVQNKEESADYTWSLPGGVIEQNETLEKALSREVNEEVGLDVQSMKLAYIHESFIRENAAHSLVTVFKVEVDCKAAPQINDPDDEIVQIKWVPVNELSHFIKNSNVLKPLAEWLKTKQPSYMVDENLIWSETDNDTGS
ncbi:NUDIX hydrolase [Gracilibacillus alcaliphilus]|uniref:NUDIX hydrolase n=1 Tax=Gracilibacillus alcaliphilus TaxID=1401441 RepID=UPI00195BD390|nr:NUDIX hydrolase [Gracilibacillus alcaliphilus]MBM7677846.1 8-oxo-dGTP diphosphatase [Gracilibacillus alcaliphilus]